MITNSVAFGDLDNQQIKYKYLEYYGDEIRYTFPLPLYQYILLILCWSMINLIMNFVMIRLVAGFHWEPRPQSGMTVKISYRYVTKGDLAASKWVNYESGVYFNNNGVINNLPGWTVGNTTSQKELRGLILIMMVTRIWLSQEVEFRQLFTKM